MKPLTKAALAAGVTAIGIILVTKNRKLNRERLQSTPRTASRRASHSPSLPGGAG